MQNKIDWNKVDGLLPVIVQNAQTCEVLMLGYMNTAPILRQPSQNPPLLFALPRKNR